jgi:predicted RNase H-like HicB family nuclease/cell fate (sporulation/competence/biofilm development) regulator YlbF (YheA/YmcA/DUF963 family)
MQEYKGYKAKIQWSPEDVCYHGKIENTTDLICFEGKTPSKAIENFESAVDDYIEFNTKLELEKTIKESDALTNITNGHGFLWHQDSVEYINTMKEALKELERLRKFKKNFDNYQLNKKRGYIAFENWQECEEQLVEIKRAGSSLIESIQKYHSTGDAHDYVVQCGKQFDLWILCKDKEDEGDS